MPQPTHGDRPGGSDDDRADRSSALSEPLLAQPEIREQKRDVQLESNDSAVDAPERQYEGRNQDQRREHGGRRRSEAGDAAGHEWIPVKGAPVAAQKGHQRVVRGGWIVEQRILYVGRPDRPPRVEIEEDVVRRNDTAHEERGKEENEVIDGQRDEGGAVFAEETQLH